ncbi:hypothetical protein [Streptomyces sp. ATCC 21386]|nr:hypothetical protein [Streptomyces sp. ATCC 21386]
MDRPGHRCLDPAESLWPDVLVLDGFAVCLLFAAHVGGFYELVS